MRASARILGVILSLLLIAGALIWYATIKADRQGQLAVSFLNVGSGEAIFVDAPSGRQVLIGGGPDDSVLRQLGEVMPFFDRSIDVVVAPSAIPAEIGGMSAVLSRYDVSYVLRSGASMPALNAPIAEAETRGTHVVLGQRGQVIELGAGAYLQILSPDASTVPNDGCITLRLAYGRTAFLFSCGAAPVEEAYLAMLDGASLSSGVLSAGASSSPLFVGFVDPQWAVFPGACDAGASADLFAQFDVQTLGTCGGTITFVSDGQTIRRE